MNSLFSDAACFVFLAEKDICAEAMHSFSLLYRLAENSFLNCSEVAELVGLGGGGSRRGAVCAVVPHTQLAEPRMFFLTGSIYLGL